MIAWALRYAAIALGCGLVFALAQPSGPSADSMADWLRALLQGEPAAELSPTLAEAPPNEPVDEADHADEFDDAESDDADGDGAELATDGLAGDDEATGDDPAPMAEAVIERGPHGHFLLDAQVDGQPITFLVDTGASHVVLAPADAERLGLTLATLDYRQPFMSANGVVNAAPVRLRELRVGQFSLFDLDAYVNQGPLDISLLGMSFLERLHGYEVERGRLVLRW